MKEAVFLKKLGSRIKEIRKAKGISQVDLGVDIDMEKSNISRLESGRINPTIFTLHRVAEALEVNLSELLDFELRP